ncbi:vomeronasal type-2 receptor 1-like [Scyliorhinus canicula]|uniref:vomeronasal type-2 receptor 1-like n=1 Tax=Scyliorhinus canicula TaxID=7830 RepID=UPI0018F38824|nr:vomeronasal type-2 receptor 1-like [Scyliorhinus canicula]
MVVIGVILSGKDIADNYICRSNNRFETAPSGCELQEYTASGVLQDGDIIIGGVFPLHDTIEVSNLPFTSEPGYRICNDRFNIRTYRWMQGMIFAVDEINNNPALLPNITLGYAIYDTCYNIPTAIKDAFAIISGQQKFTPNYRCQLNSSLSAVIGASTSTMSISMATILGIYRLPQISYFSSIPRLSDKGEFPSFFRTMPTDMFQSKVFVLLVKHFGWKWVGILADDIDYGIQAAQIFREEVESLGVCVAFSETIPIGKSREKYLQVVDIIRMSSAKIIVAFSCDTNIVPLLEEIVRQNITNRTWLASEGWSTSGPLFIIKKEHTKFWTGTMGLTLPLCDIEGLQEFLYQKHPLKAVHDIFMPELWEEVFSCSWSIAIQKENKLPSNMSQSALKEICTGMEDMRAADHSYTDDSNFRVSCNVNNAVYAVAYALHDLQACENGKGPFQNGTCANIHDFEPWQLLHYMKKVRFIDQSGNERYFDENGDVSATYDIINWQVTADGIIKFVKVGRYDARAPPGHELTIREQDLIWNAGESEVPRSVCSEDCLPGTRKRVQQGQPICCFDCIPCADGEISNGTECFQCPEDYWSNKKKDKCVPKEVEFLSFHEPLGGVLLFFSILGIIISVAIIVIFIKFMNTPIVRANNYELSFLLLFSLTLCFLTALIFIGKPSVKFCVLRQIGFGTSFSLSLSCILVKTIVVVLAFTMTTPHQNVLKRFRPMHHRLIVAAITLIQISICVGLLLSSSLSVEKNTMAVVGKIILECSNGSEHALFGNLGYVGLLALLCFVLAFLARKLPNNFNEAKFITFSLLIFFAVWISFLPAYFSTKGKYLVAIEIFAILSSSFGLLACIFFPKCYVVLLRPELNSKRGLMGRAPLTGESNLKT